ncbi:hypothetical protein D9758_006505 [Tetrapyrgos nigripes]|uniref:Uncharacterized protein n=1 Tax=Tetrapyrgos nigripes TaxID=182062 RepID=A0A8H5GKN9_9AGAR|nr:hypothetical protein D9758_006505 [Tetrapyrgos nigripes]
MSARPTEPPSSPTGHRPRRPLSPNTLRDVDLTQPDISLRKYPAPPTGHDLMAMFPPPSPGNFPVRPEPTSGYFERQERAFFAQAGREIVRVRLEVDFDSSDQPKPSRSRDPTTSPSWRPQGPNSHPQSSPSSSSYPSLPQRSRSRAASAASAPLFHPSNPSVPPNSSSHSRPALRTPPQDASRPRSNPPPIPPGASPPDEIRDDDESWRRPMPFAERRRAGKHTRRVIVRN